MFINCLRNINFILILSSYIFTSSNPLIKPAIDVATECADLIRNGLSVNRNGTLPWLHTNWFGDKALELKPGEGGRLLCRQVCHWQCSSKVII